LCVYVCVCVCVCVCVLPPQCQLFGFFSRSFRIAELALA